MSTTLFFTILLFLLGLAFILNPASHEGFRDKDKELNVSCPDILYQKGKDFYLYNSKLAKVPGVNPIKFNHLDDYIEFTKWQRSQGIRCPILYFQKTYDAQGEEAYKIRPSPTDLQGGLPDSPVVIPRPPEKSGLLDANLDDPPFNNNGYPGFDPQNQYIGLDTPLDKIYHSPENTVSANPMDNNWAGVEYSQIQVQRGVYTGDSRTLN